jgi:hypothetical protein
MLAELGGASRQRLRVATAELVRNRMLECIEAHQPCPIAAQHRAGAQHCRADQQPARQQAMEKPAAGRPPASPPWHIT